MADRQRGEPAGIFGGPDHGPDRSRTGAATVIESVTEKDQSGHHDRRDHDTQPGKREPLLPRSLPGQAQVLHGSAIADRIGHIMTAGPVAKRTEGAPRR